MVWTPIPVSLAQTVSSIFSGPLRSVAWRLFLLVIGAFAVIYLIAVSSTVVGYVLLFVFLSFTLGTLLKNGVSDIWTANFWRFNP